MKISTDGGALCAVPGAQYGTYRFSTELVWALEQYSQYKYTVYKFCDTPKVTDTPSNITYKKLIPPTAWMNIRIPIEEFFYPHDIFLGLNQALPRFTRSKLIAFSHGLSFLNFPHLYKTDYNRLRRQLEDYTQRADAIIVSSRQVKKELIEFAPDTKKRITILPFGLPQAYANVSVLKVRKEPFFLYVGSDQAIKNIPHLLEVFAAFRKEKGYEDWSLRLVGTNLEKLPKGVIQHRYASLNKLQQWYSSASAYMAVSQYESFNFPVIEALSLGCPVIGYKSAVIPEQRQFTHCAVDVPELIDFMKHAAGGVMPHIDRKLIRERFSWEHYVKSLEKLYNTV